MVLKRFDILEPLSPKSGVPQKRSVVITGPHLEPRKRSHLPLVAAGQVLLISTPLESGDDTPAPTVGRSCVKGNQARQIRNPSAGKPAILPAGRVAALKRSGRLPKKMDQTQ